MLLLLENTNAFPSLAVQFHISLIRASDPLSASKQFVIHKSHLISSNVFAYQIQKTKHKILEKLTKRMRTFQNGFKLEAADPN